jgi:hypothetical protein
VVPNKTLSLSLSLSLSLGARSFFKFLNVTLRHAQNGSDDFWLLAFKLLWLCVDTVIFAVILELGVRTSMDSEHKYNSAAELQLLICLGVS